MPTLDIRMISRATDAAPLAGDGLFQHAWDDLRCPCQQSEGGRWPPFVVSPARGHFEAARFDRTYASTRLRDSIISAARA